MYEINMYEIVIFLMKNSFKWSLLKSKLQQKAPWKALR